MVLLISIYVAFTIKVNLKVLDKENDTQSRCMNLYIRILTDYFQILSTLFIINVNFSFGIGDIVDKFSYISAILGNFFTFFYPLNCIYHILVANSDVVYLSLYFLTILYPIIFMLNLTFWGAFGYIKKIPYEIIRKRCFSSIFLISYMVQPSFINSYFKYIHCIKIGNTLYIADYLKEECWVGDHLLHFLFIILPSLGFWMVVYPLIVLTLLSQNQKKRIQNRYAKNEKKFSFFTDGLKEQFYYWEILLMFRKYIFIILSIFNIYENMTFNIWLMGIFSFLSLLFQIEKNPYEFEQAVRISLFANTLILMTVLGILFLLINNSTGNQFSFICVFIFLNMILMVNWGNTIYKLKKKDLTNKLGALRKTLIDMINSGVKTSRKLISSRVVSIK